MTSLPVCSIRGEQQCARDSRLVIVPTGSSRYSAISAHEHALKYRSKTVTRYGSASRSTAASNSSSGSTHVCAADPQPRPAPRDPCCAATAPSRSAVRCRPATGRAVDHRSCVRPTDAPRRKASCTTSSTIDRAASRACSTARSGRSYRSTSAAKPAISPAAQAERSLHRSNSRSLRYARIDTIAPDPNVVSRASRFAAGAQIFAGIRNGGSRPRLPLKNCPIARAVSDPATAQSRPSGHELSL